MKPHPLADIFPLLNGSELKALADDVKANGLREPIALFDGMVLDGRNRLAACKLAKVEPRFKELPKDINPLAYVISSNLRRDLTPGQKAMAGAVLVTMPRGRPWNKSLNLDFYTAKELARIFSISRASIFDARAILVQAPEEAEAIKSGEKTINEVREELRRSAAALLREAQATKAAPLARASLKDKCDIRHCDFEHLLRDAKGIDAIITDPPYPKEFLPLYGKLAELSKDIPLVAVMCGQTWLPEIMASMCKHLRYRWTMAYMLPGVQGMQNRPRIRNGFKPVLLFGESAQFVKDVYTSGGMDKEHHEWGQSVSGMTDLVNELTAPRAIIEYKNEHAKPPNLADANYMVLKRLANAADLPLFVVTYRSNFSSYRVLPVTILAFNFLPQETTMTEGQYVRFLHELRAKTI